MRDGYFLQNFLVLRNIDRGRIVFFGGDEHEFFALENDVESEVIKNQIRKSSGRLLDNIDIFDIYNIYYFSLLLTNKLL